MKHDEKQDILDDIEALAEAISTSQVAIGAAINKDWLVEVWGRAVRNRPPSVAPVSEMMQPKIRYSAGNAAKSSSRRLLIAQGARTGLQGLNLKAKEHAPGSKRRKEGQH